MFQALSIFSVVLNVLRLFLCFKWYNFLGNKQLQIFFDFVFWIACFLEPLTVFVPVMPYYYIEERSNYIVFTKWIIEIFQSICYDESLIRTKLSDKMFLVSIRAYRKQTITNKPFYKLQVSYVLCFILSSKQLS